MNHVDRLPGWARNNVTLWRWTLGSVLLFAMAAATFATAIFSALGPVLVQDSIVTRAELGRLVSAFAGVGAIGSLVAGRLADAFGGRRAVIAIFVVATASTVFIAVVPTYAALFVAALLAGLGNALANPATNRLIVSFLPQGERGTIMGVKQSGVQLKFFLGGLLLPAGVVSIGWMRTVLIAAGVLFSGVVAAALLLPKDSSTEQIERRSERSTASASKVYWLVVYGFLMGAGGGVLVSYLPLYAHEALGFSVTEAGAVGGAVGLVGVFSRIAWGRWSESARHFGTPLAAIALISALSTVLIVGSNSMGAAVLWVGAMGTAVGVTAWNSVGMLAAATQGGDRAAGHFSGLVVFGFLSGFTVGPIAFGSLIESSGDYTAAWIGVAALFAVATRVAWSDRRHPSHLDVAG